VYPLLQNRKILSDQPRIKRTLRDSKFLWLQVRAKLEGFADLWSR